MKCKGPNTRLVSSSISLQKCSQWIAKWIHHVLCINKVVYVQPLVCVQVGYTILLASMPRHYNLATSQSVHGDTHIVTSFACTHRCHKIDAIQQVVSEEVDCRLQTEKGQSRQSAFAVHVQCNWIVSDLSRISTGPGQH